MDQDYWRIIHKSLIPKFYLKLSTQRRTVIDQLLTKFTWIIPFIQSVAPCCLCKEKIKHTRRYQVPTLCRVCFNDLRFLPNGLDLTQTEIMAQLVCDNVDGIATIGDYSWPLSMWLSQLKFSQELQASRLIGYLLARQVEQQNWPEIDLVCALPLHPLRWVSRGYNQSVLIMSAFLKEIGIPVYTGLVRHKYTRAQSASNREKRLTNIANAFIAIEPILDKKVLLIDDVLTTGASIKAATLALKNAGATDVYIACGATRMFI